jgi:hypothetical protein
MSFLPQADSVDRTMPSTNNITVLHARTSGLAASSDHVVPFSSTHAGHGLPMAVAVAYDLCGLYGQDEQNKECHDSYVRSSARN